MNEELAFHTSTVSLTTKDLRVVQPADLKEQCNIFQKKNILGHLIVSLSLRDISHLNEKCVYVS